MASWIDQLPATWRIGVILGSTGAGKTRALEALVATGHIESVLVDGGDADRWPEDQAVVSVIADVHGSRAAASRIASAARVEGRHAFYVRLASRAGIPRRPDAAITRLSRVGLNTLPTWLTPFSKLSNGQRCRASVAARLTSWRAV